MTSHPIQPAGPSPVPDNNAPLPSLGALRTDTLSDSVMILMALMVVQRAVGFGRAILFCRWLPAEELGQWDMAFGFLVLAGPVAVLALPGTFGRYVERYRQRGQLRAFLRRALLMCAAMALTGAATVYCAQSWFSQLIFGTPDRADMVVLLAVSLLAVVASNFFTELFTALRNVRFVAGVQLANGLLFAALGVGLLLLWRCQAGSVVVAYGGACLITSTIACCWLWRSWGKLPEGPEPFARRTLWSKVVPFAGWILTVNLLTNLFEIADRYMIVHYSSGPTGAGLALVGDYHSSRIVPLLLVSIAGMLSAMITPHLSHDWEAGRRDRVAARLNLFIKLLAFALTAAGVAVTIVAPLLFDVAFQGKFAGGLAVLPWTLTYCTWFGIAMIVQTYLWCSEKAYLASIALLIGLTVNVGLNLVLLPRMGLLGAVLATTIANLVALVLLIYFTRLLGFHLDRGAWVVLAAPLAACLGPAVASLLLLGIVLEAVNSDRLLSADEKRQLAEGLGGYLEKFRHFRSARSARGAI
ncbi:MAG: lipopolysaccharide biosynthesis protein [Candidatus Nealsonbacteria bacterium]|nr:lipopolysaccharide biosynthesis protein [Candidatus Nealsonbacteria bacterium]